MVGEDRVLENIKTRRSVKNFQPHPVPREAVEKILEAGRFAPSALNTQPWKFIVIDDKKIIEEFSGIARARLTRLYRFIPLLKIFVKDLKDERAVNAIKKTAQSPEDTVFYNAPLLIFVANDKRCHDSLTGCSLAAQNMMLAAHGLGVGSCFIGRAKFIPVKTLLKRFGLAACYDIKIHLAFGYPGGPPRTPPPRKDDTVIWVK
jgi:nitroreductase